MRSEQETLETHLKNKLLKDSSSKNFQKAYDELHDFFLKNEGNLYSDPLRWFSKIFLDEIRGGKKVLDIGCGNGKLAIALAQKNNEVIGLDISTIALQKAKEKLKPSNEKLSVSFKCGDARQLPCAENKFDFVISHDLIEHISEEDFMIHLREVNRVLKPGGCYLFWTPSRLRGGSSLGLHLKEYTIKELDKIIRKSNFKYTWIDARFYLLKLELKIPQSFIAPIIWCEAFLEKIIGYVPGAFKKFLVPPLMFRLQKIT